LGFTRPVGTIGSLKKQLEKGGGSTGAGRLQWIPANGSITVRFLTEPDGWANYLEHYDKGIRSYFPCTGDNDCEGCKARGEDDWAPSSRYLANALDTEKDRVVALKLPKDLVTRLVARYEKYDTLMDRDYELSRIGTGKDDTFYDATPEPASARKLTKYQLVDLEDVLQDAYNAVWNPTGAVDDPAADDDDDELEKPAQKAGKPVAKSRPAPKFQADEDDDDVPEEDDEEEDVAEDDDPVDAAEEEDYYSESELKKMTMAELRAIAKDYGIPVAKTTGKDTLVEKILAEGGEDGDPF
jgi:hypothetical protein